MAEYQAPTLTLLGAVADHTLANSSTTTYTISKTKEKITDVPFGAQFPGQGTYIPHP